MQSDSPSRNRPISTELFFDWTLLVLILIVSRVDFIFFMHFLEAVDVKEYCSTAGEIGWQLCASRCLREQRLDEPSSQRVGGFGLAESRQSYVRGVAISGEPPKLQQVQPLLATWDRDRALLPSCDTRSWRAEPGMHHADMLWEATAGMIAKPVSAPYMILQCGTWYGCVAVWPCGCVVGGGMGDAIGSKNTCITFSTEFFDWRIQSEFSVEKSWVEKALSRLRKRARFGLQSKTAVFDWQIRLHKNGLNSSCSCSSLFSLLYMFLLRTIS